VLSLQPWFGAGPTRAALDAGIATVGQLHALAAAGAMPSGVRGLGPSTWSRMRKFLLADHAAPSAPVP
jgi:hypothetical protein